jgi:hypothetical protein
MESVNWDDKESLEQTFTYLETEALLVVAANATWRILIREKDYVVITFAFGAAGRSIENLAIPGVGMKFLWISNLKIW